MIHAYNTLPEGMQKFKFESLQLTRLKGDMLQNSYNEVLQIPLLSMGKSDKKQRNSKTNLYCMWHGSNQYL